MTSLVGKYPFDAYGVLAADELFGYALETQTLSLHPGFLVDEAQVDPIDAEPILVHELAHQWFGDDVAPAEWSDVWLNEGHATWYEALTPTEKFGVSMVDRLHTVLRTGQPVPRGLRPGRVAVEQRLPRPLLRQRLQRRHAGALRALPARRREDVLRDRAQVGAAQPRRSVSTEDFIAHVVKVAHDRSLDPFLRDWLYGTTIPPMPGHRTGRRAGDRGGGDRLRGRAPGARGSWRPPGCQALTATGRAPPAVRREVRPPAPAVPCAMVRYFAVSALLVALAPFQWSAKPLPQTMKSQLKQRGFWKKGCPVGLGDLRLLTVSHLGYDGAAHQGQLVVNRRATGPLSSAFRTMYRNRFPIRHMRFEDFYGPERRRPTTSTASFECRQAVPSPCTAAPGRGRGPITPTGWRSTSTRARTPTWAAARATTRRRSPTATAAAGAGMIGGRTVRAFAAAGWGWGGAWTGDTKDYMHFSFNGH